MKRLSQERGKNNIKMPSYAKHVNEAIIYDSLKSLHFVVSSMQRKDGPILPK